MSGVSLFGRAMFVAGRAVRETGQALDRVGQHMQGRLAYVETLSRHRRLAPLGDKRPQLADFAFVAPNSVLVGDVKMGAKSAVYYNSVVRGDVAPVTIGANSVIGDECVVHVSSGNIVGQRNETVIGDNVLVEAGAILHACTVESGAVVQSGAIVLDGAVVESGAIVGPRALVGAGKRVPAGEYWAGSPAAKVRAVTPADIDAANARRTSLMDSAAEHERELAKDGAELYNDKEQERSAAFGVGFETKH
eukprot:TRINITY_DN3357_c0_g1_i1.p1 TRINITY_DN3357_c0_g1~~TRINITY_DN3357_c0_g1_i1.p1  ORF type:complete len:264 (-),score=150.90 TRINITY_DN3357_c0_g1_i1:23-769(-)